MIEQALETGTEPPLRGTDLMRVISSMRPTTLEWLQRARNYVEFANDTGRYAEVAEYLASRSLRKRLKEVEN